METFLPLLFGAGTVVILLGAQFYESWARNKAWTALADALDLEYLPDQKSIAGIFEGLHVRIHIEVRGSGKSKRYFTIYEVDLIQHVPPDLVLTRQGLLSSVSKIFGGQDIEVDHKEFDDRFLIKGHDEFEIKKWLKSGEVRRALLELSNHLESTSLQHGALSFERSGTITDKMKLERDLRRIVSAARSLVPEGVWSPEKLEELAPAVDTELGPELQRYEPDDAQQDSDVLW